MKFQHAWRLRMVVACFGVAYATQPSAVLAQSAQPAAPAAAPSQANTQTREALTREGWVVMAAERASRMNPKDWDWPIAANQAVRESIINEQHTQRELRNLYVVLLQQSFSRVTPNPANAAKPLPPPPANRMRQLQPGVEAVPDPTGPTPETELTAANAKSHGRGFRELEKFYGGNGYLSDSISERTNEVDYILAKGGRVFVSWLIHAKHTGLFYGFPPTGNQVTIRENAQIWFNEQGKITENNYFGDDLAVYTEAGGKLSFPQRAPAARQP